MKYIIICAGQSNMDGRRCKRKKQIPILRKIPKKVQFFWKGNLYNKWKNRYFGPELGFVHEFIKVNPEKELIILKHSPGGTNLNYDWNPDGISKGEKIKYKGPLYPQMIEKYRQIESLLQDKGEMYRCIGVLWMQGESDSTEQTMANAYKDNLRAFIHKIRCDIGILHLPFLMGRIYPQNRPNKKGEIIQPYSAIVRQSQDDLSKELKNVRSINIDDIELLADMIHFNAQSQLKLGIRFAQNLNNLIEF
jgi:carbohydrate esterase-like sialic acid-specific acetylesterase